MTWNKYVRLTYNFRLKKKKWPNFGFFRSTHVRQIVPPNHASTLIYCHVCEGIGVRNVMIGWACHSITNLQDTSDIPSLG